MSSDTNLEKNDQAKCEDDKLGIVSKFNKICKLITVEPIIALYQFAVFLSKPAFENLELEKSCRVNLNYSDEICDSILSGHRGNYTTENNNIQIAISKMHTWQQPIQSFMPLLLIIFLGSYSDRHKWRKPFFIIPLIGDCLGYLGCIMTVVYMRSWPLEVQGFFQKIIPSLFGSQPMIIMSTTAYIADISTKEDRTLRIGLATLLMNTCIPISQLISGILFKKFGYYGVLSLSCTIFIIAFIYGVFWVKEESASTQKQGNYLLLDIFNPRDAIRTFGILFKNSPILGRIRLLILFAILQRCAQDGEENIIFLYVQNVFQWTPVDLSYFRTTNSIISLVGNSLGLWLLVKIFKLDDLIIIFITVVTRALSQIIFGIATTTVVFYIGLILSILTRLNRIAKRSYATKIVSTDDIGKTISILGLSEALAPVMSVPIYNLVYQKTLEIFPSTVFYLNFFLYSICSFIILYMYWRDKNSTKQQENLDGVSEITHI